MKRGLLVGVLLVMFAGAGLPVTAQTGPRPLSEAGDITLRAVLPGECRGFSPDGRWLGVVVPGGTAGGVYATETLTQRLFAPAFQAFTPDSTRYYGDGLFDLTSGQLVASVILEGGGAAFSPDGGWLTTDAQRYEVAARRISANPAGCTPVFDPAGTLFACAGDGVYDPIGGESRFPLGGAPEGTVAFSPDGSLLAAGGDGLYVVASGERRFAFAGLQPVFSPDGERLAAGGTVYDPASGDVRYTLAASAADRATFSPGGSLIATGTGVFDARDGTFLFEIPPGARRFSPDGMLLAVDNGGLYETNTGALRLALPGASGLSFSADGGLLAAGYLLPEGSVPQNYVCAVYASARTRLPPATRYGWGSATSAAIRTAPSDSADIFRSITTPTPLFFSAASANGGWLRIGYAAGLRSDLWVWRGAVAIEYLPPDLVIVP